MRLRRKPKRFVLRLREPDCGSLRWQAWDTASLQWYGTGSLFKHQMRVYVRHLNKANRKGWL